MKFGRGGGHADVFLGGTIFFYGGSSEHPSSYYKINLSGLNDIHWVITSFSKTTLLQSEGTVLYYQPLPITRNQVRFYANSYFE